MCKTAVYLFVILLSCLSACGASTKHVDSLGQQLFSAVRDGRLGTVEELLKGGVEVDPQNGMRNELGVDSILHSFSN